jgi:hypothetical protein
LAIIFGELVASKTYSSANRSPFTKSGEIADLRKLALLASDLRGGVPPG